MIINENLINVDNIEIKDAIRTYSYEFIRIPQNLIENQVYSLSGNIIQSDNGTGHFLISIWDNDYKVRTRDFINPVGGFLISFTYKKGITEKITLYPDDGANDTGKSAKYSFLKLRIGNETEPYLPHISKVKPENQAIFPIGGVSRSIPSIEDIRGLVYVS